MGNQKPREGWSWPSNSRKAHYLVDGRSLCGRCVVIVPELEEGNDDSPDNCAKCRQLLKARNVPRPVAEPHAECPECGRFVPQTELDACGGLCEECGIAEASEDMPDDISHDDEAGAETRDDDGGPR